MCFCDAPVVLLGPKGASKLHVDGQGWGVAATGSFVWLEFKVVCKIRRGFQEASSAAVDHGYHGVLRKWRSPDFARTCCSRWRLDGEWRGVDGCCLSRHMLRESRRAIVWMRATLCCMASKVRASDWAFRRAESASHHTWPTHGLILRQMGGKGHRRGEDRSRGARRARAEEETHIDTMQEVV